jgi:hypothetical protein
MRHCFNKGLKPLVRLYKSEGDKKSLVSIHTECRPNIVFFLGIQLISNNNAVGNDCNTVGSRSVCDRLKTIFRGMHKDSVAIREERSKLLAYSEEVMKVNNNCDPTTTKTTKQLREHREREESSLAV